MRSIQRQLLVWLLGGIFLATAIAGVAIYLTTLGRANDLFDYQLQQTAISLPAHLQDEADYKNEEFDEDIVIQVWNHQGKLIYTSNTDLTLPRYKRQGFQTVNAFDETWRIYSENRRMNYIQIAQPDRVREELAVSLALRSLIPFFLLIPVILLLAGFVVKRSLRPLQNIVHAVQQRTPVDLQPLPTIGLPAELAPIAHSLNDFLARLEKALSAQRAFIADAAHELRSPLTALKLQLQLAERAKTEGQRTLALAKLHERLNRATHLLEQLLTLARHEASPGTEAVGKVGLADIIRRGLGDYAALAESRQIVLAAEFPDPDLQVLGNAQSLQVLLGNLLKNALNYTPAGGAVTVCAGQEHGQVLLRVTDNGVGIAQEDRQRVFDRFYRTPGNEVAGTGLGLAIVQNIVEQHGATIRLDDNPQGAGLQASVLFPDVEN
jgi:two-component system OmpR family sensor kinase